MNKIKFLVRGRPGGNVRGKERACVKNEGNMETDEIGKRNLKDLKWKNG